MVFSSTIFLFLFLPLVLLAYFLIGNRGRNLVLLLASLVFYAWGETLYVFLMLGSILANYSFGVLIDKAHQQGKNGKSALAGALLVNLGLLGFFKYANFVADNLNRLLSVLSLPSFELAPVHLPIGISFFTFQALSYVIDLYRRETVVQKNPFDLALYISLFPQLIAGPIVRYHDVARDIKSRVTGMEDVVYGIQRFIIGLGKKVLLANVLGRTADYIFSVPPERLFPSLAWIGAISYTLQIYFDFSGYSDMAIGLGRIFGFHFLENFNYPYMSRSVREFWRRWHISLSTWFRDYLYIPLGGSRGTNGRTYLNLLLVFFLCGLWHGASWTFVAWGLFHGFFLALERNRFATRLLARLPQPLCYLYTMLVVVIGWVFFRADSFSHAFGYLQAMVDFQRVPFYNSQLFLIINSEFYVALYVALLGSFPLFNMLKSFFERMKIAPERSGAGIQSLHSFVSLIFFAFVLAYSIASVMGGSYNPFLYFRF